MNKHQIRAIKASFQRDIIFLDGSNYGGGYFLKEPIMRKTIEEIKLASPYKLQLNDPMYILTKGKNTYKLYAFEVNHTSRTFYVITLNEKIIYWTLQSIFIAAIDSFHLLTEVYHGYGEGSRSTSWTWKSVNDFTCIGTFLTKSYNENPKHFDEVDYLHTDYERDYWNKHKKAVIDKAIITQEEANQIANELYYHL